MLFDGFKGRIADGVFQAAGIFRSDLRVYAQRGEHPGEDGVPFVDFFCHLATPVGQGDIAVFVYANIFMWDQKWEKPVFVTSEGVEYKMNLVTDANKRYDIASREIYEFYKANSSTFERYGSYSWNTDFGNTIFCVYSSKTSEIGGYVKVRDRFGNEYTQEVKW